MDIIQSLLLAIFVVVVLIFIAEIAHLRYRYHLLDVKEESREFELVKRACSSAIEEYSEADDDEPPITQELPVEVTKTQKKKGGK